MVVLLTLASNAFPSLFQQWTGAASTVPMQAGLQGLSSGRHPSTDAAVVKTNAAKPANEAKVVSHDQASTSASGGSAEPSKLAVAGRTQARHAGAHVRRKYLVFFLNNLTW